MTVTLTDNILDSALGQLLAGEEPEQVVGSYPAYANSMGPLLEAAVSLKMIEPVEMPTHQALSGDRNSFLEEISKLQLQPAILTPYERLKGWSMVNVPWLFPGSERPGWSLPQMRGLLLKAALVLVVLFTSAGSLMVAAESSLPGSPIYSIKLAGEQARLVLNRDPVKEAELHFNMAQERVQEMIQNSEKGNVPQEITLNRLEAHIDEAYNYTAQVPDDSMFDLLTMAQEMTLDQEQALIQAQAQANEQAQTLLKEAARLMAQWRLVAEEGLRDPQLFRLHHGNNRPENLPEPMGLGDDERCAGACDEGGDMNNQSRGSGDPTLPGGSPGSGAPGGNTDCFVDCDQNGDGDQNRLGGEEPPPAPGPGQPGDDPECAGNCDQSGEGNHSDLGREEPPPASGPGGPGGDPDCTGDCGPSNEGPQSGQEGEEPPPAPGPGDSGDNSECTGGCDQGGAGPQNEPAGQEPAPASGPGEPETNPDCSGACDQGDGGNQTEQGGEEPPPASSDPGNNSDCPDGCDQSPGGKSGNDSGG